MTSPTIVPSHPGSGGPEARGRARARLCFPAMALVSALVSAMGPAPALAQVADAWLRYTPLQPFSSGRSTRLQSMGNLAVAVWDDQNRFDPYFYANNPAGLIAARDTSVVESPTGYEDFHDTYFGKSHSAIQRGASLRAEFRPGKSWAIAGTVDYGRINSSRHDGCPSPDDCRFIRDFDLPVSPELNPPPADRTFGANVEIPAGSLAYAREFFKSLSLGLRMGYQFEQENRLLIDPYDLDVTSSGFSIAGGALYRLPVWSRSASLSGWAEYVNRNVTGKSESSLNDDTYDWDRPEVAYGADLHIRRGAWLEGILDGRHRSYDGEEVASINWAPQFYLNPFPSVTDPDNVFKRKWSAFLSGYRRNEGSTRWLIGPSGVPAHLGARWMYYREFQWIRPNDVVLPTVEDLDVRREGYQFAGGLSIDLPDQAGVVAAETRIGREFREDFTNKIPDLAIFTKTYHFGGEYRVKTWLPLRGGVELVRHDPNRGDDIAPLKGTALTLGAGYYWNAFHWKIDASYAHLHFNSTEGDPADEIGYGDRVSLFIQRLF